MTRKNRSLDGWTRTAVACSLGLALLVAPTSLRAEEGAEPGGLAKLQVTGEPQDSERVSVLVYLSADADRGPVRAFATGHGGFVKYEYDVVMKNVINLRDIPVDLLDALSRVPGVDRVEKDEYVYALKLEEATPLVRGLQSQITGAGLSADGTGVRVCVADTGIDMNHIMYADRIDTAASFDFHNNDSDPDDDNGHGAHVAGIAVGGTGLSVDFGCEGPEPFQGVAPEATLIGAKILDRRGAGFTSNIIAGINHCADQSPSGGRADVINLSIGTGNFSGTCDSHSWASAANDAVDAGVVVVAASGNECRTNSMGSPACGSKVIAVGATYNDDFPNCEDSQSSFAWSCCSDSGIARDDIVCFSNQSDLLDVAAPGAVMWSASIGKGKNDDGTSITTKSGTSMSSPMVAGLAALVLDVDPTLTPAQVRQHIRDGAVDLGTTGFDRAYGHGRIDVIDTLNLVGPGETCGNGTCAGGEDQCSCPTDCGSPPATETNCTDGIDNDCNQGTDCSDPDCATDPACADPCGDGTCDTAGGEDQCSCEVDCGTPPATETNCTDGIDNDCNQGTDCNDPDCDLDPACDCAPKNDPCASDLDCCSLSCKPNGRCR